MNQSQEKDLEFIKNHWDLTIIEKERNVTRIIRYSLIILAIIAFFFPRKLSFLYIYLFHYFVG
ncbi:hypothetical protein ACK2FJ_03350 [Clostridioides difficile]